MSHLEIFNEIERILKIAFKDRLKRIIDENDLYIVIENSDFYLRYNEIELTVGFGTIHSHFNDEYENVGLVIDKVFSLITNNIKVVDYIKGNEIYKTTVEIEHSNIGFEHFGSMQKISLLFWKEEKIQTNYFDKLINANEIKYEFEKLKAKNVC